MQLMINIPKRGQKLTNGDVIKAVFPDFNFCKVTSEGITALTDKKCRISINIDWWNAPYKADLWQQN